MDEIRWRKSTYSSNGGASCIEVGQATRTIAVRDTKQHGRGPVLRFTAAAWRQFAEQVKDARKLATDASPQGRPTAARPATRPAPASTADPHSIRMRRYQRPTRLPAAASARR